MLSVHTDTFELAFTLSLFFSAVASSFALMCAK
jgi:hypothetical protein